MTKAYMLRKKEIQMIKDPMTWTAERLSKGKYADYKFPVMVGVS